MLQSNGKFNDSAYDTFTRFYGQMAEFDRLTNQTRYKQSLKQCFDLDQPPPEMPIPIFVVHTPTYYELYYGYAAAQAYAAYHDLYFLDLAVTAWTSANQATISEEQAASGTVDGKQFNLSLSCQGATLAGGTYRSMTPSDPNLTAFSLSFQLYWRKRHLTRRISTPPSNQQILYSHISSIRPISYWIPCHQTQTILAQ